MVARAPLITILVISVLCLKSNGDFPQLHRALPGANGKPGYRVTSSQGAKVGSDDNSNQYKNSMNNGDNHSQIHTDQMSMELQFQWSQAAIYSIASCVLVGLTGIFPLILIPLDAGPSLQHGAGSARLKLLLGFAAGSLVGDVFLHLLPEAWATVNSAPDPHWAHTVIGLWAIFGMLFFLMIEKIFGEEDNKEDNEEETGEAPIPQKVDAGRTNGLYTNGLSTNGLSTNGLSIRDEQNNLRSRANGTSHLSNGTQGEGQDDQPKLMEQEQTDTSNKIHISGYLNLLANFTDNFTHGLAVGGSYLISPKVGFCTTIAILLHEVPHEIGDFAILLRSGFDRWRAAKAQVLTATGGILGALTALMSESAEKAGDRTAAILPFSAGGFLYIALVTVVPELLNERSPWESFKQMSCVMLGVLSMLLVTVVFEG